MQILSLRVSNFLSFRDEVLVDFSVRHGRLESEWARLATPSRDSLSAIAMIGANASGKTSLLKVLAFTRWLLADSFVTQAPESPLPVFPHLATADRPVRIACEFVHRGIHYRYQVECTPQRIIQESLDVKRERFGYLFERTFNGETGRYQVKTRNLKLAVNDAYELRQNASLVAIAAQFSVPLASTISTAWKSEVRTNVTSLGLSPTQSAMSEAIAHYRLQDADRALMATLLCEWDLGLSDVTLEEVEFPLADGLVRRQWVAFGEHVAGEGRFRLPFVHESLGTGSAFVLLSHLLPVLRTGGVAVIDSLENDLHPHILQVVLDLFQAEGTNPHAAQLIFSTHAVEVLERLRKAQVVLIEKDDQCASTCYRLDELRGVRNDENRAARYLAGAYGAVPNLI